MAAPSVFPQALPKQPTDAEDEVDPFPYIIVRLDNGLIESQVDPYKVSLILLIGIYDDGNSNQGHRSVLEIVETIQQHYEECPRLANQFTFSNPFRWALQEEDSFPYFFGGIEITFDAAAPRTAWSDLV